MVHVPAARHHCNAADFWSTQAVAEFSPQAEEPQECVDAKEPPLPFRASFYHLVSGSHVAVREHLCRPHGSPVRGIVLFLPGVWGGIGPGRAPGHNFDKDAIFPTVASKITKEMQMPIDCYRLSWSRTSPSMDFAVECVMSVLKLAHQKALRQAPSGADHQDIQLYLVGHSYGGAIAFQAALRAAEQRPHTAKVPWRLAGLCILNTILLREQLCVSAKSVSSLSKVRSLLLVGDADGCPEFTAYLHERLPAKGKELRVLPQGTHDLFAHRDSVANQVSQFIVRDVAEKRLAST